MDLDAPEWVEATVRLPRGALGAGETAQVEYFSQHNCELIGLRKRAFLALLRRPGAPEALRIGKDRLVRRDVMLDYLQRIGSNGSVRPPSPELDAADRVLLELDCTPLGRSR